MSLLNSPIQIGRLEIVNRLVMPPMATAKSQENGEVTRELCEYYAEKSRGGHIGLIITEHSYVSPAGKASKGQVSIAKDSDIAGLEKVVEMIHQNGSKTFAQLAHAGGLAKKEITGYEPLSASAVELPETARSKTIPTEMTEEDIQKLIADFAAAALRAKRAGFDGVELHSAHGYLLNQFYSPLTNRREDRYHGHSIDGRIRLHLDILQAIREIVGEDYPVAIRLGASDHLAGGTTIEDSVAAAKKFEEAGVCLLDISGGFSFYTNPYTKEQGYFSDLTESIKQNVRIPVLLTGGIVDGVVAERLLREEKADMIGVGRAILKDSDWAKQAISSLG
ncbi:NADH:flavin oxidoreductase [Enterococcus sp. AZ196]|uniref:NADH:flavin oxidoreductase n=1 Tax=Enterococcus sp. AZ196 TaxID=2774659 RepID=UPI003D2D78D3